MQALKRPFNRKLIFYFLALFLIVSIIGFIILTSQNPTDLRKSREKQRQEDALKNMPEASAKDAAAMLAQQEDSFNREKQRKEREKQLQEEQRQERAMKATAEEERKKELAKTLQAISGGPLPPPPVPSPRSGPFPERSTGEDIQSKFNGLPAVSVAAISKPDDYENYGRKPNSRGFNPASAMMQGFEGTQNVGTAATRPIRGAETAPEPNDAQPERMGGKKRGKERIVVPGPDVDPDEISQAITPDYPISDYMLQTGSHIPVVLLTGINSQNAGQVVARTTADIYDSINGRRLLIPRGAKVIGKYNTKVAMGTDRLPIAFEKIIIAEDGRTILIPSMPGADMSGEAGVTGEFHGNYLSAIIPPFLVGLAGQWASRDQQNNVNSTGTGTVVQGQGIMQQIVPQIAGSLSSRYSSAQPYFTIDRGEKLLLQVSADIAIPPYGTTVIKISQNEVGRK